MVNLLLLYYFVCLVLGSMDINTSSTNTQDNKNGPNRWELISEITNLRQLLNQESFYRQELEGQMRELRKQMMKGNWPGQLGMQTDTWNGTCTSSLGSIMTKLESIATGIDAKTLQVENVKNMVQIIEARMGRVENEVTITITKMLSDLSDTFLQVKESLEKHGSWKNGNIAQTQGGKVSDITHSTTGKITTEKHGKGHMGKNFAIMAPPDKSRRYLPIYVVISCESNTTITIRSSYYDLNRVFDITPPGENISIPIDFALDQSGPRLQPRAIELWSTEFVSVYVFNEDAHYVLPSRYLGRRYKVLTTDHGGSFVSIMPYGGSATIQITSTKGIANRTIDIPRLHVYSFWTSNAFKNVMISSNQKIAVISGHYNPKTLNMKLSPQIIYDSIPPVQSWNTTYIIPFIQNTTYKYDFLYATVPTKITAIRNFTTSQETITLPHKYIRSDGFVSNFVETVQGRMAVVLWYYWGTVLNTFMCVVPALSQFSNNYRFWTPFYYDNNFLAAIIKEEDWNGLMVDNSPVANPYMSHPVLTLDETQYRVLTIGVSNGWHSVKHDDPRVRFGLIMYGGDLKVAYGLPLGLRLD